VNLSRSPDLPVEWDLFGETASEMVVSCGKQEVAEIEKITRKYDGIMVATLGETVAGIFELAVDSRVIVSETVAGLRNVWSHALAARLMNDLPVEN
jgi:hypothetical protein